MAMPRLACGVRLLVRIAPYSEAKNLINAEKNDAVRVVSSSSSSSDSDSESEEQQQQQQVTLEYHKGLPKITVPLPSRRERCSFTLKPISNTVGEFLEMLRKEDRGIDRAVCRSMDGTRIASSNTIETLLDDNFKLVVNDTCYTVTTPKPQRATSEEVQSLSDIKNMVNNLYRALHVDEHQITKEKDLLAQMEALQQEIQPLEEKRLELELVAHKKNNWLVWAGLGLMSAQFGILARLTWWEYSWDIMEPVTYFVTYGTAMACYAYFVLTKEEYVLTDIKDRQHLLVLHGKAKKLGVDLDRYNHLKDEIHKIEYQLRKLRNPLKLRLPPKRSGAAEQKAGNGTIAPPPAAAEEKAPEQK
ncbi:calcium uniporter protein, mitochondrial [Cylas formicarius]|uniref:calcium uniporter protein, mitochondrial n=1 Tax=Cylas formicarius TaxID=197179 RepID=UPI00295855FF|nr:calcium uniporter protein, mitochondrial [Cylas formicarius]